jgi:hypothetical protein
VLAVEYEKRTPRGPEAYRHAFAPHARPVLAHDERGQLHLLHGRYTTTDRGIEDQMPKQQDDGYVTRANPSLALPHHEDGSLAHFAGHGAKISATAGAYYLLANAALRRAGLGYAARAAIAGGVGVVSGLALARFSMDVGLGLFTAGVVTGLQNTAAEIAVRQALAGVSPSHGPLPAQPQAQAQAQQLPAPQAQAQPQPQPQPQTQTQNPAQGLPAPGAWPNPYAPGSLAYQYTRGR